MLCIPKSEAEKLKEVIRSGDIPLQRLYDMSSEDRHTMFTKYLGEQMGTKVNVEFEKAKLTGQKELLKEQFAPEERQQLAQGKTLSRFAQKMFSTPSQDKIARLERRLARTDDPIKIADIKARLEKLKNPITDPTLKKIDDMKDILDPKQGQDFLRDLVASKMGFTVSPEEGKVIVDLTNKAVELKKEFNGTGWTSDKAAADYGAARVALENYKNSLTTPDTSLAEQFKEYLQNKKVELGQNAPVAIKDFLLDTVKTISDTSVSIVASLDDSFLGRQGLHTLMTHPTEWWPAAKNSITDFTKTLTGHEMQDALMADIYSKPNFINGNYDKAGILPHSEEQFPTSLPERIWGLGKVFKASEVAFKGSAVRMRTGLFDLIHDTAIKNGVDMTDEQIKDNGKLVNALTARGQWGKTGEPAVVRLVLWAPKMLKANIDVLTAHGAGSGLKTNFARKQAAYNLLKILAASAGVIITANAIKPGSAETDPRSSNFGKIKIGNTSFDYSGGAASLITLASRIISGGSISTKTGLFTPYGTAYGQQNSFDAVTDFLVGKTTPPVRAIIDLARGTNAVGQPATVGGEALNIIAPIGISNIVQLKDDHSVAAVAGAIADIFGINANTHISQTDWQKFLFGDKNDPMTKELTRLNASGNLPSITDIEKRPDTMMFRAQVTPKVYAATMDEFKTQFKVNIDSLMKGEFQKPNSSTMLDYKTATNADKAKMITTVKSQTLKTVLAENGYDKGVVGTASFEGKTSYFGNPNVENLQKQHSDDGKIIGQNPKGEPVFERFPLAESSKIKDQLYNNDPYWKANDYTKADTQLDHIVPIEAGGTMTKDNLMLISNVSDVLNQPFEDYLGQKYKDGTISRADAIRASIDYKINKSITLNDVKSGNY